MMRDKIRKKRGFTLAELLIVVAIIAVLVAVGIPVFSKQLEKSREATDLANVRTAYAQVMSAAMSEDHSAVYEGETIYKDGAESYSISVPLKQQQKDWQGPVSELGGVKETDKSHWIGVPSPHASCTVSYSEAEGVKLNWGGFSFQTATAWTHKGGNSGVGATLYTQQETPWAKQVTAVTESLDAKIGGSVNIKGDQSLSNYKLGFYAVDPTTNVVLYDSKEIALGSGGKYTISNQLSGSTYNGKVKIVVQLINTDKTTHVSEAVADKIMQQITITN